MHFKAIFQQVYFLCQKGTLSSCFLKATAKGSCEKSSVIKECHQRLLKFQDVHQRLRMAVIQVKTSEKAAEVTAVLKDCDQRLLQRQDCLCECRFSGRAVYIHLHIRPIWLKAQDQGTCM